MNIITKFRTGDKEMTDEEMAEAYSNENWEHYEEGQNDSKALKQAYLAGLIEGRKEKWHDLRKDPNDLPTIENLHNFSKYVLCAVKFDDFVFIKYQVMSIHYPSKTWIVVDSDKNYSNKNVIAWCEISKFEE